MTIKRIDKLNIFSEFVNQKLQFTYPWASIKDVQATGETFSTQKRTSSTSKHEFFKLLSNFVGHFCPLGSGSSDLIESGSNPDLDPKHCREGYRKGSL